MHLKKATCSVNLKVKSAARETKCSTGQDATKPDG